MGEGGRGTDSVITLVDQLVHRAVTKNSSDIHLESTQGGLRVRYRIDGVLYDQEPVATQLMPQVLSRIKLLANVNIAERRVPQDGKVSMRVDDRFIDLRISTFPTVNGEKIVIRILDRARNNFELDQLGFQLPMLAIFYELISRPNGLILVTGPTGSGKTTTLYATLVERSSPDKNIVTLEDPVEYYLDGITQGQIHPLAGFTFESGIRALLRQDPDVVMVGEIRDAQTAHIAVQASLAGQLVLSTLHTNDAPGAVMRLLDMGVEHFLINAALSGVLAQRLARTLCKACKAQVKTTPQEQRMLKRWGIRDDVTFKSSGCSHCFNLGYKGRTGIFELLVVTDKFRALTAEPSLESLRRQAIADGMLTLHEDGLHKVEQGIISLAELVRVVGQSVPMDANF